MDRINQQRKAEGKTESFFLERKKDLRERKRISGQFKVLNMPKTNADFLVETLLSNTHVATSSNNRTKKESALSSINGNQRLVYNYQLLISAFI